MNYRQTLDYLYSSLRSFQDTGGDAYKPGLERIESLVRLLGNPQRRYPTVHVAGTNGKGSVSHIIAAVLQQAGYRTGLFTSPHLHDFRERIRIDGRTIEEDEVVEFVEQHRTEMEHIGVSFFEMTAAMAFERFAQHKVDVAVIETGLGGRLDATNIILPIVSVITNIGLEHTEFLGSTIAKIAAEKAGIIKTDIPAVIGEHHPESDPVFIDTARARNAELHFAQDEFEVLEAQSDPSGSRFEILRRSDSARFTVSLDLGGSYQRRNIVTALAAIEQIRTSHLLNGPAITDRTIETACRHAASMTGLAGRWQRLGEHPTVICDTGHNAHGLKYVAEQLSQLKYDRLFFVLGVVREKDLSAILPLLPKNASYIFTHASVSRALDAEELRSRAAKYGLQGCVVRGVAEALAYARSQARPEDLIFVGGSTFTVAEII